MLNINLKFKLAILLTLGVLLFQSVPSSRAEIQDRSNYPVNNTYKAPEAKFVRPVKNISGLSKFSTAVENVGKADFVLMIDATGSMGPYIDSVRTNLTAFALYLESEDIDINFSVVAFKDITYDGDTWMQIYDFSDNSWKTDIASVKSGRWTADVATVENALNSITIIDYSGGDYPETPSNAIWDFFPSTFRENASKFIFLLTDAPAKSSTDDTSVKDMDDIIAFLRGESIYTSVVSRVDYEEHYYNLYYTTGGKFIDIESENYYELMLDVANWIVETMDSDGDGLPDVWETDGVDVDGDGSIDVDLRAMGADPNVPDIFIEVDYMYRPEASHTFIGIPIKDKEINLKPSDVAMRIVMEQFAKSRQAFPNGINIHIDTGSDDIMNLKTGKKWGSFSRSNTLDYSANFDTGDYYEKWNRLALDNFDKTRWKIFRYCIIVNKYNSTTSSGLAENLPGQFFIVADVDNWILHDDRSAAGTFMHELGHTLGLKHGGDDHSIYKPNYLSIMNYLYQTSGLISSPAYKTNYSEYVLPSIDKTAVNEELGIDPDSVTGGRITGAKWRLTTRKFIFLSSSEEKESYGNIAGAWIDFNQNSIRDTNAAIDFNITNFNSNIIPASVNDWERLIFRGGAIGGLGVSLSDDEPVLISMDASAHVIEELTLEEAEELGLLHNPGDCEVSSVMPDVLHTGVNNQKVQIKVRNLFDIETTAHLQVTSDLLASVYSSDITLAASADRTIELTVPSSALTAGKHTLTYTLTCANEEVKSGTTEIEVQAVKPIVLKVGESETLTGTAVGAYALSVEDTAIATIEGSTVYATEAGKTFIILKDLESRRTVCSLPIYVTETGELEPEETVEPTDPTNPTAPSTPTTTKSSGGGGGGCSAGVGLAALGVIALAAFKKQVK